jgi:hypothetical protein
MSIVIEGFNTPINDKSALLAYMIDFNTKYNKYISCNKSPTTTSCSSIDSSLNTVITAYQKIAAFGSNMPNVPNTDYDESLRVNLEQYDEIQRLRPELDAKMEKLYDIDHSILSEDKNRYDITIYSGIIWTILATSIVYFTFTKL